MKKWTVVLVGAMVLSGCTLFGSKEAKEGTAEGTPNEYGSKVTVKLTLEGDKLTTLDIDETNAKSADGTKTGTKKELGYDYGMKAASPIGKEWSEQIKSLEDYIKANGVDKVKTDEKGKVTNEDLKTSVTITVTSYLDVTKKAIENAKGK